MNKLKLVNGTVFYQDRLQRMDVMIENGRIVRLDPSSHPTDAVPSPSSSRLSSKNDEYVMDCSSLHLFPGFVDLHVHFREPGFSYKETIETGTKAAAHGGYTVCCTMPNLRPVPDTLENLKRQLDIIREHALVHVLPYGSITCGEKGEKLSDFEALAPYVVGFTDDGVGVADKTRMLEAMIAAKALGKPIVAHAEDLALVRGGVIHDGDYAKRHNLPGNPSESEWKQVERDIALAEETGARYHVCHISTKESVALVRAAKQRGLAVTGETAPHYLTMTEEDLQDEGRFRMNPPIRSGADREALIDALVDETLLAVATDHAPHAAEEKARGLAHSANGIVGLETAFSVLYTRLVLTGKLSLERLLHVMSVDPAAAFSLSTISEAKEGLGVSTGIAPGAPADLCLWDLHAATTIDPETFFSKGHATPFAGWTVRGVCLATWVGGKLAYEDPTWKERRLD